MTGGAALRRGMGLPPVIDGGLNGEGMPNDDPARTIIHRPSGRDADAQRLGPYRIEALVRPDEQAAATAYRVRIEPHQTTSVSYHKIAEEFYFVVAGRGVAILNGKPYPLRPGDFR